MVYVYAKLSNLQKYIGTKLTVQEIEETLKDLGMDIKDISTDKDPELKIEITAEKMDMVSVVGIARSIAYYRGLKTKVPSYALEKGTRRVIVDASVAQSRPYTVGTIVKGVSITEDILTEIIEMQEKIHTSFGRNRKKAAIGIYPCNKIKFPITYKAEIPSAIQFQPLELEAIVDGKKILSEHPTGVKFAHLLDGLKLYPVFRDATGAVLSMPPIINSHNTGKVVPGDSELFVELTGFNLHVLDNILKVIATTLIELGATIESVDVVYEDGMTYTLSLQNTSDTVSVSYVNSLVGVTIPKKNIPALLLKMQYGGTVSGDTITVEIPCFKSDVWNDCDIADDIARAYGYNAITLSMPSVSSVGSQLPFSIYKETFSQTLVQLGFLETYTYTLTSSDDQFDNMTLAKESCISLKDTAEQGINMIRVRILPELLKTLHINMKNAYPQRIFENGFVIIPDTSNAYGTGTRDDTHLCVAIADPKANYTHIKQVLDTMCTLHEITYTIKESSEPFLLEGRRADIYVRDVKVGCIGEVHPQVLSNFKLHVPIVVFEVNLSLV